MKNFGNTILIFMLCVAPLAANAQFDEQFYRPTKEWRDHKLPEFEQMWIVAPAGGTATADSIHAIWCKPANMEPRAAVLYCHGNSGNISHNDMVIAPLVEAGYAVLAWDYPGFGLSTGKPTHTSIAEAGEKVFGAMMSRDDTKGKKVIVYGLSIGCQIAAKLARDNTDRISALILDAGMVSFTEMALLFSPAEAHPMIRQYVTSPYSAVEDVRHLAGMPKLIAHSPEDTVAPFAQGERLFEAATEPKVMLEYPGGHISAIVAKKDETLAAMAKMIE
jgi:alpha-beta hydrolase superfamily lysophospholipase